MTRITRSQKGKDIAAINIRDDDVIILPEAPSFPPVGLKTRNTRSQKGKDIAATDIIDDDVIILPEAPSFPLVRLKQKINRIDGGIRSGQNYYLSDAVGVSVQIGVSRDRGTNHLVYSADDEFVESYRDVLPIDDFQQTECFKEFQNWAYKQIYFSFLSLSQPQNELRWFVKTWHDMRDRRYQVLFPSTSPIQPTLDSWMIVKVGMKIFPIQKRWYGYGGDWERFLGITEARDGYKLICGFERTWILNVIILDDNLDVVHPEWFDTEFERRFSNYPEGLALLGSSFQPSIWFRQDFRLCFGHRYVNAMLLAEDLGHRLAVFADENARYKEIIIVGCGVEVKVKKSDGGFSVDCLQRLEVLLNLRADYLLYFGVVNPGHLFVLCFDDDGRDGGLPQDS